MARILYRAGANWFSVNRYQRVLKEKPLLTQSVSTAVCCF
jgi:hypothetical protein